MRRVIASKDARDNAKNALKKASTEAGQHAMQATQCASSAVRRRVRSCIGRGNAPSALAQGTGKKKSAEPEPCLQMGKIQILGCTLADFSFTLLTPGWGSPPLWRTRPKTWTDFRTQDGFAYHDGSCVGGNSTPASGVAWGEGCGSD